MSQERTAASAARSVGAGAARAVRTWRVLPYERRLAAGASFGLFLSLFLPWYQETVIAPGKTKLQSASASVTGWGAFSFVEAAVLLVAVGVLTLLVQRAEGRAFHLPGGDGWVIMLAGFWTGVLVIWRIFDKQGTSTNHQYATTSGIEWGIFVALAVAVFLTYTGSRIRAAHSPEPPLPGDADRGGGVVARPAAGAEAGQWRDGDDPPPRPRSLRDGPRTEPAAEEAPEPAPARPVAPKPVAPRPVASRPVPARPAPARPPEPGSASDRRTGWLTAPPEGWTEDPDAARREPAGGWSYADDYADEVPRGPEAEYGDEPPTEATRPRRSAGGRQPEDPTNVQAPTGADEPPPPSPPPGRRRRRQPDDQLTIRLDRDNDA